MITKTKINKRAKKKRNPLLAKAILLSKNASLELAKKLSVPRRKKIVVNLTDLNKTDYKKVIVPGKVLGKGEINKKISVYAFGFSKTAIEKLKNAGCKFGSIIEEIEKNPNLDAELLF